MSSLGIDHPPKLLQASLAFKSRATLGEASLWNFKTQELYWVDIESCELHIFYPQKNKERVIILGQRIGTVVPCENGKLLIALQEGIYELDLITMEKRLVITPPHDISAMRYNDGKCDAAGRFWVGSMHLEIVPRVAVLYKVERNQAIKMLDDITISNGICWSLDNKTMYYIDTPTEKVRAFDFDLSTGSISNERVIIVMKDELARPDGMTIDENGMLWIAHWGGSCVTQWDPDTATLLSRISVPAYNVTSCAFGGEDLDILFITTASEEMPVDQVKKFPLAGSLFQVKPGDRKSVV